MTTEKIMPVNCNSMKTGVYTCNGQSKNKTPKNVIVYAINTLITSNVKLTRTYNTSSQLI